MIRRGGDRMFIKCSVCGSELTLQRTGIPEKAHLENYALDKGWVRKIDGSWICPTCKAEQLYEFTVAFDSVLTLTVWAKDDKEARIKAEAIVDFLNLDNLINDLVQNVSKKLYFSLGEIYLIRNEDTEEEVEL